jgi:hypothetical protein
MAFTWLGLLFSVLILGMAAYSYNTSRRLAVTLNADPLVLDKNVGQQAGRGRFWIAVQYLTGVGALLTWFGYVAVFEHFDATRPIYPNAVQGAVIPQNNHGHIVYLTDHEQDQLLALQRIPIGLALVAILAAYFHKKATGKPPN